MYVESFIEFSFSFFFFVLIQEQGRVLLGCENQDPPNSGGIPKGPQENHRNVQFRSWKGLENFQPTVG